MRVAVTGGSGFIGSHVVDALVAAGHDVVVLDNATRRLNPHVAYVDVDILDTPRVTAALRDCQIVFHLGGVSNVDQARDHPVATYRVNVQGTASVCAAAVDAGKPRVILASSVWVHEMLAGEITTAVDPDGPLDLARTGHVYTASKMGAEMTVRSFAATYDLPWTILRYGIPYGPRMRDELVLARFVRQALSGEPLTLAGGGTQTRNFVYVGDLARAHLEAIRPEADGRVIVLDGAAPVTIRQLADLVIELTGSKVPLRHIPARTGDYHVREIADGQGVLSWQPSTSLRDGIREYLSWLRDIDTAETDETGSEALQR
jgi:UDP-glucose 4-epimerase